VVKRLWETPDGYEELRRRLAAEWQAGPDHWSPEAHVIFAELGLDEDAATRRHLVESPTFLAALREPYPLAA
jgi:hypothetical protein